MVNNKPTVNVANTNYSAINVSRAAVAGGKVLDNDLGLSGGPAGSPAERPGAYSTHCSDCTASVIQSSRA